MIGIDRYLKWERLDNAVSDARGVLAVFEELGFAPVVPPLLDDAATGEAIRRLPGSLAPELREDDSLVVFFAGHGYTRTDRFSDGVPVPKGYLIPVDADRSRTYDYTWQRIDPWLTTIAELPPRHILVILDSCHSGIALNSDIRHRGSGVRTDGLPVPVHERRSRRVLASALDNQQAMDGGPIAGHSVFTGYLIEALRGGIRSWLRGTSAVGLNVVAEYVRHHVQERSGSQQVPGLGVLEYDGCGELTFSLDPARALSRSQPQERGGTNAERVHRAAEGQRSERTPDRRPASGGTNAERAHRAGKSAPSDITSDRRPASMPQASSAAARRPGSLSRAHAQPPATEASAGRPPRPAPEAPPVSREPTPPRAVVAEARAETGGLPDRTEGWVLDPVLAAALDRQGEERRRGAHVLTIVAGEAMASQTSWGTWASRHGYLTLATQLTGLDAVVADLLAQTPWLRCVPEARKRLAAAARIDVQAVDASLDARSMSERRTWIEDVAAGNPHARVSGWLLSWLRRPAASAPDLATAPVRQAELLAIACDLASPTAVLMFHPSPDERWLERAVVTAAELIAHLPAHSIAVTAPDDLVTRSLGDHCRGTAWAMARQGLVRVDALARRLPGRARHSTIRVLFDALARDPRTRGRFELDGTVVAADGPAIDVALVAHAHRIAVELDAWYHFHDPEGYRRDRVQDTRLARAGYFVLRFPAEDVDDRLASTIEQLAIALAGRRAAGAPLQEDHHGPISR